MLLAFALLASLLGCAGVAVMRDAADRMHYLAFPAMIAPVLVAAAVWIEEGTGTAAAKAVLVAVVFLGQSPLLAHATGRAIYFRRRRQARRLKEAR